MARMSKIIPSFVRKFARGLPHGAVLAFGVFSSMNGQAQVGPSQGTLVAVRVEGIFAPRGFDDNDESQVVLDGYFPNGCYRVAHSTVTTDPEKGTVDVVQYARRYDGICIQARVPFFTEVNLGVLPAGSFRVNTVGVEGEPLSVSEASNAGPDDHLYVPVDSVHVEKNLADGRYFAILAGRFTNSCMAFDNVKVINSGKTIEILPIMRVAAQDDCQETEMVFSWRVDLPEDVVPGRHLIHVRSLNGKAVNQMVSVE